MGFWPLSGIYGIGFFQNLQNFLGILWEFLGNSLGILWELFRNCIGILWEFFMTLAEMIRIFEYERMSIFCLKGERRTRI